MEIKPNTFYKTRCGQKAFIFKSDFRGKYAVVGMVEMSDYDWMVHWHKDGTYYGPDKPYDWDLVEEWKDVV